MASLEFEIDPATGSYGDTPQIVTSAGGVVNCRIKNQTGVDMSTVVWTVIGTHASAASKPTITPAGSPVGQIGAFAVPSGANQAYGVRIDGKDDGGNVLSYTGAVYVYNSAALKPVFVGETFERNATHGIFELINEIADQVGGVGGSGDGILNVTSIATLRLVDVSSLPMGTLIAVQSIQELFKLAPDIVDDDDTVHFSAVAPTVPVGTLAWSRLSLGSENWRRQAVWYVDPDTGSNEADGATTGTAVDHVREIIRRMGPGRVEFNNNIQINIMSTPATPADHVFSIEGWHFTDGNLLGILGVPATATSGTLTESTDRDIDTRTRGIIKDDLTGNSIGDFWATGRFIIGTKYAWGVEGGTSEAEDDVHVGPFTEQFIPVGNEAYSVETVPDVAVSGLSVTGTSSPLVAFQDVSVRISGRVSVSAEYVLLYRSKLARYTPAGGVDSLRTPSGFLHVKESRIGDMSWETANVQFEDNAFTGDQQHSGCRFHFFSDNDFTEGFGRRFVGGSLPGEVPAIDGGGNTITVSNTGSGSNGGTFFVHEGYDHGSQRSALLYVGENDVWLKEDGARMGGPRYNIGEDAPLVRIGCAGKFFWEGEAGPGDTIDLRGKNIDARVGNADRNYQDLQFGHTDAALGAVFRPRDES